jgi:uncharacterized protein YecT (DUF1311 family)
LWLRSDVWATLPTRHLIMPKWQIRTQDVILWRYFILGCGSVQFRLTLSCGSFAIAILFLTIATCCQAQHMNVPGVPCNKPSSGAEETNCFVQAYKDSDQELNRTYSQIRRVVGGDELTKLQAAQRLWVKFRDANCAAERELYSGGSAASMVYAACMAADTRQRTAELMTMYGWRLEK